MSEELNRPAAAAAPPSPANTAPRRLQLLLAFGCICYFGLFYFHPEWLWNVGVNHYGVWFLDTFALLASNDAVTRGLNVYLPNPLDYFHRPHVYSHWWLHLRDLGLTRADSVWLGLSLVAAFLVAALSRLRPTQPRQLLFYLAVVCSSPVLLAVNRANNDLVIFLLLTPLVSCLLDVRPVVRWAAPVFIAAAAALKYYPAAGGLVLLAAGSPRELRWRVAAMAALFVLVGYGLRADLAAFAPLAPKPEGFLTFGAMALFRGLGWDGWLPKLVCLAAGAGVFATFWRSKRFDGWVRAPAQEADWLHFILGASLLTGCFFAGLNFSYRWVFAIWLAPLLWSLLHDSAAPVALRRLARLTAALLLVVLWIDVLACLLLNRAIGHVSGETLQRSANMVFVFEQPLFWAFFACLLAFLSLFAGAGWRMLRGR